MPIKKVTHLSSRTKPQVLNINTRHEENVLQRELRLANDTVHHRTARANETPAHINERRGLDAVRHQVARAYERPAQRVLRLEADAHRHHLQRAEGSPEGMRMRLRADTLRQRANRADEDLRHAQERRNAQARRQANLRHLEDENQRLQRLAAMRQRNRAFMRRNWGSMYKTTDNYDPDITYELHPLLDIGRMNKVCTYCHAYKWAGETAGLCCASGKVELPLIQEPPEPLNELLRGVTDDSVEFLSHIRSYNSAFAMTSFRAENIIRNDNFSSTFAVEGQRYHRLGNLLPNDGYDHAFLQIYFMGYEDQVNRRCAIQRQIQRQITDNLQRMLHENNILIREFKIALDHMPNATFDLILHADKVPPGEHERIYNIPSCNEIAALVDGDIRHPRDIVLQKRGGGFQDVNELHRFYDALQYPLLYWQGQEGYRIDIPQINPATHEPLPNKKVSALQFYSYHAMIRENSTNIWMLYRELLHQFIVDMWIKIETERLLFIILHQPLLRAEEYIHMRDAMLQDINVLAQDIGQPIILPSSYNNSPRYLAEYTQDTFTYVRKHGKPDLFLTFTCNPQWIEITRELQPGQQSHHRIDIIARVFRQKVIKFINVLIKGKIFGNVVAYTYSVEWQKRGLPHIHVLLWLADKIQPRYIDNYISAEIPDSINDPNLHNIVTRNMVHGPCGLLNPNATCMKNRICSKNYPRALLKDTVTSTDGYPLYRRRSPDDGGFTVRKRITNRREVEINNSWIVPYSPVLSRMFNAHINVEVCNSVKAIKYIMKYINKGSDRSVYHLRRNNNNNIINNNNINGNHLINANNNISNRNINNNNNNNNRINNNNNNNNNNAVRDEVTDYKNARYVSSNEAYWRLFSFPVHERYPAVVHLAVHLENGERIYFNNQQNLEEIIANRRNTTLTAFFNLCQNDDFARTLLYPDVPKFYTWNTVNRRWCRRRQGTPIHEWPGIFETDTLGRVYTVHITNFECYCLRLLLHNVRGPTSFDYLKTVDGVLNATFIETCQSLHLLENDNHWIDTMADAELTRSSKQIRQLFAILITTCDVSNAFDLWDRFKDCMSDDIRIRNGIHGRFTRYTYEQALSIINNEVIIISGRSINEFQIPFNIQNIHVNTEIVRETSYDLQDLQNTIASSIPLLTNEQATFRDNILNNINNNTGGLFFLDAPGGTGKTFLLNLLLSDIRFQGDIALGVSSSGISSTMLKSGRTAHSLLKIPLDVADQETPVCSIRKNSFRGELLRRCKLIVWDECTMSHKKSIEALNRTLQDINSNGLLMGGMVVILSGDFRQILPVIKRGTPADEFNACFKSSILWRRTSKFQLTINMRANEDLDFANELIRVGEDLIPKDNTNQINLNNSLCTSVINVNELIDKVYPDFINNYNNDIWLCERALLAPTNANINELNTLLLQRLPGDAITYTSRNTLEYEEDSINYPTEFLNSIEMSGFPTHTIHLKVGAPIILMRNLRPPILCNGTRLRVTFIGVNVLKARILTGTGAGEEFLIPKIPMYPNNMPFKFKRLQFPIKLAFALTINKSQGQTLSCAGVDLRTSCFTHGQLYVAFSRVRSKHNLFVLAENNSTDNIVYQNAIR